MKKVKTYFIIGALIGLSDVLGTCILRFILGNRSKWNSEEGHDIWLVGLAVIQAISSILIWPIKIVYSIYQIILILSDKKSFDKEMNGIIKNY